MTPARLLAPAALVVAALALVLVVTSGGGTSHHATATGAPPATSTTAPTQAKPQTAKAKARTYTVQAGDTPSGIAAKEKVDVDALLKANPDVDAKALTVGTELKLP